MKGQDLLVLFKVLATDKRPPRPYRDLSSELGMSASEVLAAERRLQHAGLLDQDRSVNRCASKEFLLYGLKYVFPATLGGETLGMPTGRYAPPLKGTIEGLLRDSNALPWVWPSPKGDVRGMGIEPLYRSVPVAASRDEILYAWLAVVDCLRVGRARERRFAENWISRRLQDDR
jgi:hypothetical protein